MVASNNYINDYYYLYRHGYWIISLEICIEKINTSLSFPSKLIWERSRYYDSITYYASFNKHIPIKNIT